MLSFDERFAAPQLDRDLWVDHYLPHWTTPERSAARYDLDPERGLVLRIDADQPAWLDQGSGAEAGRMRVSSIQTATFSGPAGSAIGTHRHDDTVRVVTETPHRRLWTASGSGRVEVWLRASADESCMLAAWLVGVEDTSPDDAGEITIAELFGDAITPEGSRVRLGVKAVNDPRLRTDVVDIAVPFDASAGAHRYGAEWDGSGIRFFVDGVLVHRSEQRLDYPVQLLVDLFEFPQGEARPPERYPKTAEVRRVTGQHFAGQPETRRP
jgi:hypothetical protein